MENPLIFNSGLYEFFVTMVEDSSLCFVSFRGECRKSIPQKIQVCPIRLRDFPYTNPTTSSDAGLRESKERLLILRDETDHHSCQLRSYLSNGDDHPRSREEGLPNKIAGRGTQASHEHRMLHDHMFLGRSDQGEKWPGSDFVFFSVARQRFHPRVERCYQKRRRQIIAVLYH